MRSRLTPLIKLFYSPRQAMVEISARASYLVGALFAIVATIAYYELLSARLSPVAPSFSRERSIGLGAPIILFVYRLIAGAISRATPVLFLVAVFVPALLLSASVIHRRASFTVLFRQEYAPLASCALYAWAAAHLIMLIPAMFVLQPAGQSPAAMELALKLVPLPYFVFLITLGVNTVLRVGNG